MPFGLVEIQAVVRMELTAHGQPQFAGSEVPNQSLLGVIGKDPAPLPDLVVSSLLPLMLGEQRRQGTDQAETPVVIADRNRVGFLYPTSIADQLILLPGQVSG